MTRVIFIKVKIGFIHFGMCSGVLTGVLEASARSNFAIPPPGSLGGVAGVLAGLCSTQTFLRFDFYTHFYFVNTFL